MSLTKLNPGQTRIALIGAGLGGTHYAAGVLQHLGLDVGHEKLGKDGIVSWLAGPGARPEYYDPIITQLRNPRKVATSWGLTAKECSIRYADLHLKALAGMSLKKPYEENRRQNGVIYTLGWYRICIDKSIYTYRVEDMEAALPDILAYLDLELDASTLDRALQQRRYSRKERRKYDYMTWDEIESFEWGEELYEFASRWNYI
jgi:hypothetical protein